MGRDICWPAGEIYDYKYDTEKRYVHTCYESYRGYEEDQKQYGKRIVVNEDGIIKKSLKRIMLEEETFAPTNYAKRWDVVLEPGDYIISSLRVKLDYRKTKVELEITRFEEQDIGACFRIVLSEVFEIEDFKKKIDLSKQEWGTEIEDKLLKGVRKALKIPKHINLE